MDDRVQSDVMYEKLCPKVCHCKTYVEESVCSHPDCYGSCEDNWSRKYTITCKQCHVFRKLCESQEMKKLH